MKIVVTCEHASRKIPKEYAKLFSSKSAQSALKTHRGYDIGAREVAEVLSKKADFFIQGSASRLLIDLNRSLGNKKLFSEWSFLLTEPEKAVLINHYYSTYRETIKKKISHWIKKGEEVLHISVHSFTPELDGEVRKAEIGLLYDPAHKKEQELARVWQIQLRNLLPAWRIRCNYPYHGKSDGLTTYLRKQFPKNYLGIEIEINQQLFSNNSAQEIAKYFQIIFE